MRTWTESACVVLAWSILLIILAAAGMNGSVYPAQANTRTAGSTNEVILTSAVSVAASPVTAASHTTKYVVRSGDTLSGIAARFAARRLARSLRGQPPGHRPRPGHHPHRYRSDAARPEGAGPLHSCGR